MKEKLNPLFEMAKLSKEETGLPFVIDICNRKTKHGGRIKFPFNDSDTNSENWSSISLPKFKIDGKKRSSDDMKLLNNWAEKYKNEVIKIGRNKLDFDIFRIFILISLRENILDNFIRFSKQNTGLPLDIMLDEYKGYTFTETPLVVVCLDKDHNFIGVVGVNNPQDYVFTEERFTCLSYELSPWINKYRNEIKMLADKKITSLKFSAKLEYDLRNP